MTALVASATNAVVSTDDLLDNLLSDFKISQPTKIDTPEDHFVRYFTSDKFSKVAILVHWLRNECAVYDRALEYGLFVASNSLAGPKRATFARWVRILVEHYLMTYHPHWFIAGASAHGRGEPADMGLVIDRLLEVEAIKKAIFSENRA